MRRLLILIFSIQAIAMTFAPPATVQARSNQSDLKYERVSNKTSLAVKRLVLEKCFLLLQKEKLEKLKEDSNKVKWLIRFIERELQQIEGELERRKAVEIRQDFA